MPRGVCFEVYEYFDCPRRNGMYHCVRRFFFTGAGFTNSVLTRRCVFHDDGCLSSHQVERCTTFRIGRRPGQLLGQGTASATDRVDVARFTHHHHTLRRFDHC